jgi:iron complex outermembrane receptor protein
MIAKLGERMRRHKSMTLRLCLRRTLGAGVSLGLLGLAGLVSAGDLGNKVPLNIPPQSLSQALTSLAQQADLQILFAPELVVGMQSPALSGTYSGVEALEQLLASSKLQFVVDGPDTVVIRAEERPGDVSSGDNSAPAQRTSAALSGASQDKPSGLEEIVVTAQKRTENVQDVPKSVDVASQDALVRAGVTRLNDIANIFPSVTLTDQRQNAKPPGIRGIVTVANATSVQAKTGIVIDDIPQPTFSTLANELSDVERVEVFAGPQSTLSGRNAAGGLINFVTRAPSHDFAAEVRAEQTTDRQSRMTAFLTGPISEQIAFSLSAVYNDWDGPLKNVATGERAGGFDSRGGRGKLLWEPTDALSFTLTGYYLHSERLTPPILGGGPYIDVAPGATHNIDAQVPRRTFEQLYPGITPDEDNRNFYSLQTGTAETTDKGSSLRIDYDLGEVGTISSLSNYSTSEQPRNDIFVGSPQTNVIASVTAFNARTDVQTDYWSQEFRLVSPGAQTFTYLLGAIYSDSDLFQPYSRPGIFAFDADRTSRIKSLGVFGRGTYSIGDADAITAGLRYQMDDIAYTWLSKLPPLFYSENSSDYDFFGGELSYKHDFTSDVNAYVTLSHSESGQAYDIEDTSGAQRPGGLQPLASEKVDNIEIGMKTRLFDRLTLNANVFRADYENYQVQTIDNSNPNLAPVIRLLAIGEVRTQGIEISSVWRPIDDLKLGLSGVYNEAEIRDYPNAACYVRQTAAQGCMPATPASPANQGNLKGKPLQAAPKVRINASVDFRLPIDVARLDFNIGGFYRYQSKSNFSILNDPAVEQPSYGVTNLYLNVGMDDGKYLAELFVNNVFDEVFYSVIGNESQINARQAGYDRNSFRYSGLRLTAKF